MPQRKHRSSRTSRSATVTSPREARNHGSNQWYSYRMQITISIPDEFAKAIAPEGKDAVRIALEALALEGYRSEALSESDVRQMLGFGTRMQVHSFLKEHGVYLQYGIQEFEHDMESARKLVEKIQSERASRSIR